MRVTIWVPEAPGDRLYVKAPFELADTCRSLPGRRWDPDHKAWHVPATAGSAAAVWQAFTGNELSIDQRAADLLREAAEEAAAMKHKDADDAELPEIPGKLPAWLHQKRAYHFASARRSTMLAMDMGTGKSRTAVSLLEGWDVGLVLILAPKSVVNVWPNQFALHGEADWKVIVPPTRATVSKRAVHIAKHVGLALAAGQRVAVIVNYEAGWRPQMKDLLIDLASTRKLRTAVVLDESHRIKAPGGSASTFAARLCAKADRVLALTGTPMPHSPLDIYAQFRALDPGVFGTSFNRFKNRYAIMGGFEGRQVVGYQRQDELATKLGAASFVVKKDEAGLDLPDQLHIPDVTQDGPIDGLGVFELGPESLKAYKALESDFVLGVGEGTVTTANALTKLLRLQQVTSGYVRDDDGVDHEIGSDKIEVLEEILGDLPTDEPVVVFARFQHDIARIRALCEQQGRRVGELSGSCRDALNEHSQMAEGIDVAVVQVQSGGVGIDLTRAAYAIYYSLDWSLGNYEQSLARLHRPGQTRPVTYYHLIAKGTKDEVQYRALRARKDVVEAVIASSRGELPRAA